jgi:pimeloyl-ACP methyl ester carboxylesterase
MAEAVVDVAINGRTFGVSILAEERGPEWVVCFHGLQSNKDMFTELVSKEFFGTYSVLLVDFIGFGSSSKPNDFSYALEEQAKICRKLLDFLKIDRAHIIGHSMGGMVGTLLLELIPERIVSFANLEGNLVLENCGASSIAKSHSFEEFRKKIYPELKEELRKSDEPSAPCRVRWLDRIPDFAFYKTSISIVDLAQSGRILEIFLNSRHKRLYLYGEKNRREFASLNVPSEEIPHAGHFMLLDNFESTCKAIRAFMD